MVVEERSRYYLATAYVRLKVYDSLMTTLLYPLDDYGVDDFMRPVSRLWSGTIRICSYTEYGPLDPLP